MLDISPLISGLQSLPNELILIMMYVSSVALLGLFYRFLGVAGVYVFMTLGVIIANVQVLKAMDMILFSEPVAMGTTIFMTTFLATDLIAEHHGRAAARKAIWCGFLGVFMITISMILTLGMPPVVNSPNATQFNQAHFSIQTLFSPAPAIFLASLTAYLISQYTDISIFLMVKRLTGNASLWLRSFVSTSLSSLIDSIIFSVLAWKILVPLNIDFTTLIFSYIFGTYILRLILTMLNVPALYFVSAFGRQKAGAGTKKELPIT